MTCHNVFCEKGLLEGRQMIQIELKKHQMWLNTCFTKPPKEADGCILKFYWKRQQRDIYKDRLMSSSLFQHLLFPEASIDALRWKSAVNRETSWSITPSDSPLHHRALPLAGVVLYSVCGSDLTNLTHLVSNMNYSRTNKLSYCYIFFSPNATLEWFHFCNYCRKWWM